ncbi:MAG: phytanoyl-CoA dioxygenase family protein [Chitinophagaceae bacterium]
MTPSTEKSSLGIMHLKRYWEKAMARREGSLAQEALTEEWNTDITMLSALGLGLEQTIRYLFESQPDFDEFEQWIRSVNNSDIAMSRIEEFNRLVHLANNGGQNTSTGHILTAEDIEHWNTHGYVIIREAVTKEACNKTIEAICNFLDISINDPSSWYKPHPGRQGIMVQLFQHPILEENRRSEKIRAAYEQLWGRTDLWMNTDRVSFNPPQNELWTFPGPRLHWDVSLELPIPYGLQGLLYLSDTKANQGAFTLVPGFHNTIGEWIGSLPPGTDPRKEDLHALGAKPIAANAGDFIIWHQALPHGSSPNTANVPRLVQYINYIPADAEIRKNWV